MLNWVNPIEKDKIKKNEKNIFLITIIFLINNKYKSLIYLYGQDLKLRKNIKLKKITIVQYSLFLIGFSLVISGFRWMIDSEPWLLDKVANEERLQFSFNELFSVSGNETLPNYLKQIYRFLGMYVFGTGLFLLSLVNVKLLEIQILRVRLLAVLGLLLITNILLAYFWIPSSHFILLMWGAIMLYLVTLYNHFKI